MKLLLEPLESFHPGACLGASFGLEGELDGVAQRVRLPRAQMPPPMQEPHLEKFYRLGTVIDHQRLG